MEDFNKMKLSTQILDHHAFPSNMQSKVFIMKT